jgi:hypothetical protein
MTQAEMEHVGIPDWGIDLPSERRPGAPKEASPRPFPGAHWSEPSRQASTVPVLKRADIPDVTPVFGTASPPSGLSGKLRRLAYASPDHKARHWLMLLAADRVDALEHRLDGLGWLAKGLAKGPAKVASKAGSWLMSHRIGQGRLARI